MAQQIAGGRAIERDLPLWLEAGASQHGVVLIVLKNGAEAGVCKQSECQINCVTG